MVATLSSGERGRQPRVFWRSAEARGRRERKGGLQAWAACVRLRKTFEISRECSHTVASDAAPMSARTWERTMSISIIWEGIGALFGRPGRLLPRSWSEANERRNPAFLADWFTSHFFLAGTVGLLAAAAAARLQHDWASAVRILGLGLLFAGASMVGGWFFGLLFGIPRSWRVLARRLSRNRPQGRRFRGRRVKMRRLRARRERRTARLRGRRGPARPTRTSRMCRIGSRRRWSVSG